MNLVIALGGNALLNPRKKSSYETYEETVNSTCRELARIIREGHRVAITHGNGPQVGDIMLQQEKAKTISLPLDVDVAETQGQIGYLLERGLYNELEKAGIERKIITILTQVLVDPKDPAFSKPSKPVGRFYSKSEMLKLPKSYSMAKINGKYRRVVPSPKPQDILEKGVIKLLFEKNHLLIVSGGGGIPVIKEKKKIRGMEAVIDKDMTAGLLAKTLKADMLLILTDIDGVYLDFGQESQRRLDKLTASQALKYLKEGQFREGSMGPKVQACIDFVKATKGAAVIARLKDAYKAMHKKAGTEIGYL
ncbi:MAG: carbamate kinase [Candidatus Aenigmarchaeota archaeon]|nr:carbamate kinase [Candidatus Aenigmarchaeota archaeon]